MVLEIGSRLEILNGVAVVHCAVGTTIAWDRLLAGSLTEAAKLDARAVVLAATSVDSDKLGSGQTKAQPNQLDATALELEGVATRLAFMVRESPLPLVMACEGTLRETGCLLSLMVDGLVAAEGSHLIYPFRSSGIVVAGGVPPRLVGKIGSARANEFVLLGAPLPVETARNWGLLRDVVKSDLLIERAVQLSLELANDWPSLSAGRSSLGGLISREAGTA